MVRSSAMRSTYFVPVPFGVETATENEIAALGGREIETRPGGVRCKGDRRFGYAANLWLRSAIRVQEWMAEDRVRDARDLYDALREIDWSEYMDVDQTLAVDATVSNSEIRHSKYAALVVKDAIVDQFRDRAGRRPDVDRDRPDLPLKLVVDGQSMSLWRNMSGPSLHKRGYRDVQVKSPLNEALAAGLLLMTGWDPQTSLVDPMCGSGTFVIEAALLAMDRAPGLLRRRFAFESWPDFDRDLMDQLRSEARERARTSITAPIVGADRHGGALSIANRSARQAGVDAAVRFVRKDAKHFVPEVPPSIVVTNPPYGERLGDG
ncbi:MAG: RNA methyltransferase, partial [Planctomycetes bacterium]|nr:RNA methyltransferase [Planctomycetota bacterium]